MSGLDAITFQVREPAFYAENDIQKALVLSDAEYKQVFRFARSRNPGMRVGVALGDIRKVRLFESVGSNFYKVLSRDLNDYSLIRALVKTGKPVWVSTGMANEDEICEMLRAVGPAGNLRLIHTQLSYNDADTNLRAIERLRVLFGVPVGFGMHATDPCVLFASLAFNPAALFIYVKGEAYPRHRDEGHAVPLADMRRLTESIRRTEAMLGDGVKRGMTNTIPDQQR